MKLDLKENNLRPKDQILKNGILRTKNLWIDKEWVTKWSSLTIKILIKQEN